MLLKVPKKPLLGKILTKQELIDLVVSQSGEDYRLVVSRQINSMHISTYQVHFAHQKYGKVEVRNLGTGETWKIVEVERAA